MIKEELKWHNIDLDNIEINDNFICKLQEAIFKMREYTLKDRFEVILNNNLIEAKDKYTGFRMILGCRISYADLDKNISFVIREDTKPSYEELQNRIDKALEYMEKHKSDWVDEDGLIDYFVEIKDILKGSDK